MYPTDRVYALDIETDTSGGGGLDPATARITSVAISGSRFDEVFADGDEATLLTGLWNYIAKLPAGLIATWNGAFFDLPFLVARNQLNTIGALDSGMTTWDIPGLTPKYSPLPGRKHALAATWLGVDGTHSHLDVAFPYRRTAHEHGVPWSLKPVCRALEIDMIEVDRANMHLLTAEEERAYVSSDADGTRQLAVSLLAC